MSNNKKPRRPHRHFAAKAKSWDLSRTARAIAGNNKPMSHKTNKHRLDMVFGPVESLLDEMERTGESDALPDGTVVFRPPSDATAWYPLAASLDSLCYTYDLIACGEGLENMTEGLRRLAKKIEVDMPLFAPDLAAARKDIAWMRAISAGLTPIEFSDFIMTTQLHDELVGV